jgi:Protein of unknown function (DUF1552)
VTIKDGVSLSRRRLLAAAGSAGGALMLPAIAPMRAYGALPNRKRFIIICSSFVTRLSSFMPTKNAGGTWSFGSAYSALNAHTGVASVLINSNYPGRIGDGSHSLGHQLFSRASHDLNDISIDGLIATSLAGYSPRNGAPRVLRAGINGNKRVTALNRGDSTPPNESPSSWFDQVFGTFVPGGMASTDNTVKQLIAKKRSVLDFIKGDVDTLSKALTGEERNKLDVVTSTVRDAETALEKWMKDADIFGQCDATLVADVKSAAKAERVASLQSGARILSKVVAAAFACDLTRVMSLSWLPDDGSFGTPMNLLPGVPSHFNIGWHEASHLYEDAARGPALDQMTGYFAREINGLLNALRSVPEVDGNLLDNTLVLWGYAALAGDGGGHNLNGSGGCAPLVLFGRAGGAIRPAGIVDLGWRRHTVVLNTIAKAYGVGDPSRSFGPFQEEKERGVVTEILA